MEPPFQLRQKEYLFQRFNLTTDTQKFRIKANSLERLLRAEFYSFSALLRSELYKTSHLYKSCNDLCFLKSVVYLFHKCSFRKQRALCNGKIFAGENLTEDHINFSIATPFCSLAKTRLRNACPFWAMVIRLYAKTEAAIGMLTSICRLASP